MKPEADKEIQMPCVIQVSVPRSVIVIMKFDGSELSVVYDENLEDVEIAADECYARYVLDEATPLQTRRPEEPEATVEEEPRAPQTDECVCGHRHVSSTEKCIWCSCAAYEAKAPS